MFGLREAGVSVKNLDIIVGEVTANLNEALLSKSKTSTDTSQIEIVPAVDSATAAQKQNKKQVAVTALAKYTSMIPEKVSDFIGQGIWCFLPSFL